ncbi:hypothetical protein Bbelb_046520 [Branchiostoma belcheri]|nr:hypothetical protein Bbelb_046520 [Branchiostoma belcheri]
MRQGFPMPNLLQVQTDCQVSYPHTEEEKEVHTDMIFQHLDRTRHLCRCTELRQTDGRGKQGFPKPQIFGQDLEFLAVMEREDFHTNPVHASCCSGWQKLTAGGSEPTYFKPFKPVERVLPVAQ